MGISHKTGEINGKARKLVRIAEKNTSLSRSTDDRGISIIQSIPIDTVDLLSADIGFLQDPLDEGKSIRDGS